MLADVDKISPLCWGKEGVDGEHFTTFPVYIWRFWSAKMWITEELTDFKKHSLCLYTRGLHRWTPAPRSYNKSVVKNHVTKIIHVKTWECADPFNKHKKPVSEGLKPITDEYLEKFSVEELPIEIVPKRNGVLVVSKKLTKGLSF